MKYVNQIIHLIRGFWAPFDKNNAKIVLLCLLSATIFWLFNALNKEYTARVDYPIEFVYDKDSLVSVKELPENISLNVTGGGWNLLRKTLRVKTKPIIIDLENPGGVKFLTQYNLLNFASDQLEELAVNFVISDTVFIDIDQKISERCKVLVDTAALDLAEGYFLNSDVVVSPDSVTLVGPKSIISTFNGNITLTIPDTQIDDRYNEDIGVNLSLPESVASSPEKVNVSFDVLEYEPQSITLEFANVNVPDNNTYTLRSRTARLHYLLPKSRKGSVDTADFRIIADFSKIDKADSTLLLQVEKTPGYVKNMEIENPEVKVIMR